MTAMKLRGHDDVFAGMTAMKLRGDDDVFAGMTTSSRG
jgi:hypothetical protein